MKAIRVHEFGGPECMIQDEIDDPTPSAGEILVKIEAAGVNPVDTYIRSGVYAHLPDLPYIPGGDGAGVVEALGSGVTGFAVGQRVYIARIVGARLSGCYAERIAAPAVEVFGLPENTSYAAGATMGVPCATAYHGSAAGAGRPARPCSCTGRVVRWGSPPCNSHVRTECASSAVPAATLVAHWSHSAALMRSSITPRRATWTRLRRSPRARVPTSFSRCSPT